MKKNFEKEILNFFFFLIFSPIFSSDKSPASGKENVRFLVSPDFEGLPDFRTGQWCPVEPYWARWERFLSINKIKCEHCNHTINELDQFFTDQKLDILISNAVRTHDYTVFERRTLFLVISSFWYYDTEFMNKVGGYISIVLLCTISRLTSRSRSAGLAKAKHNWLKSFVESKGASANKDSADLVIPFTIKKN